MKIIDMHAHLWMYAVEDCKYKILKAAEKYGVDIQETLAIGDGWNDYSALATAGKGIAVKNAEPILKEKFEVSEYSNDENAVGRIIEKYGKVRCENEK